MFNGKRMDWVLNINKCIEKFIKYINSINKMETRVEEKYIKNNFIVNVSHIRLVEIEIFSYCNRKCWFCPNSFIDRHSTNYYMTEALYLKILSELKSINYSGIVTYSRYNEPTSDRNTFIKRLKQAKNYLPNALLHTNTNGDYLNRDYLDELYNSGLRSMNIQHYLNNKDDIFDITKIKNAIQKMSQKLDLKFKEICSNLDRYEVKFFYKDMNLNMYARDFIINGNNRGGSLKTIPAIKRTSECYIPFTDIYIDYNGMVMPCCNFRSDNDKHKYFIIGNANNDNIIEIFNNKSMQKLRYNLINNITNIDPCNECNFAIDYRPDQTRPDQTRPDQT